MWTPSFAATTTVIRDTTSGAIFASEDAFGTSAYGSCAEEFWFRSLTRSVTNLSMTFSLARLCGDSVAGPIGYVWLLDPATRSQRWSYGRGWPDFTRRSYGLGASLFSTPGVVVDSMLDVHDVDIFTAWTVGASNLPGAASPIFIIGGVRFFVFSFASTAFAETHSVVFNSAGVNTWVFNCDPVTLISSLIPVCGQL